MKKRIIQYAGVVRINAFAAGSDQAFFVSQGIRVRGGALAAENSVCTVVNRKFRAGIINYRRLSGRGCNLIPRSQPQRQQCNRQTPPANIHA